MYRIVIVSLLLVAGSAAAAPDWAAIDAATGEVTDKVVAWRHDIHANPELGNREFRTSAKVAEHLRALGFDIVETEVAHTGVVGVLKGGRPGGVVALRADMDALPVTERTGLAYASKVTTTWRGRETGVMHACGHDAHVAILMGVAEVLAGMREDIPGTVKFIFQPAEEGAPTGEEGGAKLMVAEGVMGGEHAPGAIFALHVGSAPAGMIGYRAEGIAAASDGLSVTIKGRQTHGAMPWAGVDSIAVAAQVVTNIQHIVARQADLTKAPAIVTFGSINGGNRGNIIPGEVSLTGTIRTYDPQMRDDIHERVARIATNVAEAHGAAAEVNISHGYPVTWNNAALTAEMSPVLDRFAPGGKATLMPPMTASEDFSYYANEVPGLMFMLGVAPEQEHGLVAPNHSPYFQVNDAALPTGVKALSGLALDWLHRNRD